MDFNKFIKINEEQELRLKATSFDESNRYHAVGFIDAFNIILNNNALDRDILLEYLKDISNSPYYTSGINDYAKFIYEKHKKGQV